MFNLLKCRFSLYFVLLVTVFNDRVVVGVLFNFLILLFYHRVVVEQQSTSHVSFTLLCLCQRTWSSWHLTGNWGHA